MIDRGVVWTPGHRWFGRARVLSTFNAGRVLERRLCVKVRWELGRAGSRPSIAIRYVRGLTGSDVAPGPREDRPGDGNISGNARLLPSTVNSAAHTRFAAAL